MKQGLDAYTERLYGENVPEFRFRAESADEARSWKEALKAAFIRDLGGFPRVKTGLVPRLIEDRAFEGYRRQRIVLTTDENLEMPLYLLMPEGRRSGLPAVIALHGHGTGSGDLVGLDRGGAVKSGDQGYSKSYALELVKRGFLVAVPELLGFGDRMLRDDMGKWPELKNSCHRLSTLFLMLGKTIAAARVFDVFRTLDYLETRNEADSSKIGCMGISGGGTVCAYASALDERIKAAVISGFANTFKNSTLAVHHCVCNYIPNLLRHAEMPDLIGLIAPRPVFIESGSRDTIFPREGAEKALAELETIYRVWGQPENLGRDLFEGGHEVSGRHAYEWLADRLG